MKRFIVFLSLVCMGVFASSAFAGDWHTSTSLVCSDCHTMHASKSHLYNDPGHPTEQPVFPNATAQQYLLINTVNQTCLNCHDASANGPDVLGQNQGMYSGVERRAGALNGTVTGHPLGTPELPGASYEDGDGHTLGTTAAPPGGSSWTPDATSGLECTNCHSPHGSAGRYRNLSSRPGPGTVTARIMYEVGASASSPQTVEVLEYSSAQNTNHYRSSNVDYEEPLLTHASPDSSNYSAWCSNCHPNFHGGVGSANISGNGTNPFIRHPVAGVNLPSSYAGRWKAGPFKLKVMDSQGLWTGAATDTTLTPSCMSCHKGHGNANPFGLVYMNATGATLYDEGNGGAYRDMCRNCHSQGS